jgi:hypothetical protein
VVREADGTVVVLTGGVTAAEPERDGPDGLRVGPLSGTHPVLHEQMSAALHEPDREERNRRYAEVRALSSCAPIVWDGRSQVNICWNCGRQSSCRYQDGSGAEQASCGW